MNILITGARGFLGRNLTENLKTLKDGRNKTRPSIAVGEIYEYDLDNTLAELDEYTAKADFVFHLAGVNRPKDPAEFRQGNFGFTDTLLELLEKHQNRCPVLISSSVQATLQGRFGTSEYGLSKKAGEDRVFAYGAATGARVLVYRFPNLAGKWVRPEYNSAIGTFCHHMANDLPITVNDPSVELELLFVEDLIEAFYDALEGKERHCEYPEAGTPKTDGGVYDGLTPKPEKDGRFCYAPVTHKATLGRIVELLHIFRDQPKTLVMPEIAPGSFEKKLYSMYLSYLPKEKAVFDLKMNTDERGSFTELLKTEKCGQFSVNISKPGITKGQHWHNSKWEFFIVVKGHARIEERKLGTDEVMTFDVSGERIQAVHMLPGYTHNITNLSDTEELVTLMWANEPFDPAHPDTFFEKV